MASTLVTNIKLLVNTRTENKLLRGKELSDLPCIENAFLLIEDGSIASYGQMNSLEYTDEICDNVVDASGQIVLPSWCDSHTHLVFAASREDEFIDKIRGLGYAEIAARGGVY